MVRWVAIFEDNPEDQAGWVRKRHRQEHFDYLEAHRDAIKLAGSLRPDPEAWHDGGLWVMETATREDAAALCENDPWFKLGLRKGYRLFVWGKAPFYGDVVL